MSVEALVLCMDRLKSLISLSPLKISFGYLLFGVLWVPVTDLLLAAAFASQAQPTALGLAKSWTFIALSAVLIYALSTVHQQQMSTAQTKLRAANEQLQVLHRVFRHNIRNDINVIEGYAKMLVDRLDSGPAQMHAETVRQTAEGITTISEKLTIVERIDPTIADDDVIDLVEIVDTEIERIESTADAADVTADLPATAWIEGDKSVGHAIREVFENAVVHCHEPVCEIDVSIDRSGDEVVLLIDDNGPGIPDEELKSLESGEETALVHGSSVGLWLVRWLCQLHGGAVQFSTSCPRGTTVSFYFQSGSGAVLMDAGASVSERIGSMAG